LSKGGRESESRLAVGEIIGLYLAARSQRKFMEVTIRAERLRRAYGEWRIQRLFAEAGLLDICVQEALEFRGAVETSQHITFAIDNLPDEDEVRMAFYHHPSGAFEGIFVPKRRWDGKGAENSALVSAI
jgi:hypothetical protein